MTTAARIIARAAQANLTITTAESCTGGMIAAALTDIAGASAVFERGFVTYSNAAKTDLLGVNAMTIDRHGAVSSSTAQEMADGALAAANADIAIAVTGIAGPGGGTAQKPEGLVWFGLAMRGHTTRTQERQFGALGRDAVRNAARDHALALLEAALSDLS